MKRAGSGMLYFLNIILAATLLVGPLAGVATAVANQPSQAEAILSPTEAGLDLLIADKAAMPDLALAADAHEAAMNEVLASAGLAGVARLEPFGGQTAVSMPQVNLPVTAVNPPSAPNPFAQLQTGQPQVADLAALPQPEGESETLDFGGETAVVRSVAKMEKVLGGGTAVAAAPVIYGPAQLHTIYLPVIGNNTSFDSPPPPDPEPTPDPDPIPSDEIAVTPEAGGLLISTDGLVIVQIPPQAHDEPFILRYTPRQQIVGGWRIDATTLQGETVTLSLPFKLFFRLPENRTGNPLVFRYKADGQQTVSIASYVTIEIPITPSQGTNTDEYLMTYTYGFGQYSFASITSDGDTDEGDDELVVTAYCWMPGLEDPENFVFSQASVVSTTLAADPYGYVDFEWDEMDDDGNVTQVISWIWHDPDPEKNNFEQEPYFVRFGYEEIDGETVPFWEPVPFTTSLTTTVSVTEATTSRYDILEVQAYFTTGVIACTSGCPGDPPSIAGIGLTQIGQTNDPEIGTAYLVIASGNLAEGVTFSVRVNGVEYPVTVTDSGAFVAEVEYNLNDWNLYEVSATDSCGNSINFPPIRAFGGNAIFYGQFPCKGCGPFQGGFGDPVNTQSGNYYDTHYDLTVPGVGGTDLTIYRSYNSMAALWMGGATVEYRVNGSGGLDEQIVAGPPQYFGPGWTFPYAVSLNHLNYAPLYDGVEIHYPDGHTARFVNEGGVYVSSSPKNFDTLVKYANGWTLTRKTTLDVEYFDANGRLIEKQNRNGNRVLFTYVDEYLTQVENESGRWIAFEYTDGYITKITAPEGREIRYGYTDGLLTTVMDGNGHTTTYGYDDNGQLTSIQTPKGHTSLVQTYDDQHRVDWQQIGRAQLVDFEYSEDGLTTTFTDNFGNTTIHTYNESGQLIRSEDARDHQEVFDYDVNYNRIYHKDQEGREWHWTFDDQGNRLTETGPLDWQQAWAYNDLNRVISQTTKIEDGRFRTTLYDYDLAGNLTHITDTLGYTSTITYDPRGLPERIVDFNGNLTLNEYDPVTGDLTLTRNGAGDEVTFAYDGLGRMVEMIDGNGNLYTYVYDDNDNLTDIHGPLTYHRGFRFDANDNLEFEIDPLGGAISYTYDASEMLTRVQNQLGFTTVYTYNDMDKLAAMADAEGRVWSYEYDAVYNLTAVHGPEGTHTLYEYDKVNNLTLITACNSDYDGTTCPEHFATKYEYDDLNRLITLIENYAADGPVDEETNVTTEFLYDIAGNLRVLTDALGNQTFYEYTDRDELRYSRDAEDQEREFFYDGNGLMAQLVNARGYPTTFTYDGANRLATMRDADDNLWQYFYDHNGNLQEMIDPLEVITRYEYDQLDRLSQLIQNYVDGGALTYDQNVTTTFEYDNAGNLRFVYDPRQAESYVTEHQYDAAHRRILTIDNENGETRFGYDKVNNLVRITDANVHTTTFTLDDLNRQIAITNPEGHSVEFAYDRLSNTLIITDARGYPTTFTYDGMNRVELMVDAMGGEWETTYDAMGNVQCQIDANDHANNCYTYDNVYRMETSTDAEGHTDSYSYDPNGNLLTWTDGNGHITTYSYDVLDRLESVTNAEEETTTYRYDPLGNQTHLIEADGIVTRYDYDPLYRLITVNQNDQPGQPESADVNVDTHYVYDEVGNLLTIVDANAHETHFTYDGLNRMTLEVDADFNEWNYEYDPVGNRTAQIDANGYRTDYTYYPDNQLHTISYELDGTGVTYLYDENNNRIQMDDWLGTTTWQVDPLNRMTDVTDAFGRHLGYGYDPVGNRTSLTYADGRTVQYGYYANNWLHTVTDPEDNVTSYTRDGVGLMTHTANPNNTISQATYDRANRMLTLVNRQVGGANQVISAFAYSYNDVGHRTQMVAEYSWRNPAVVTSDYGYDGLRRLIRDEDSAGVWNEYVYDRVGNRLELHTNDDAGSPRLFDEQHLTYSYSDSNRLLTIIGDTHPGQPGSKRQDNVGQAIYAFRHEVTAQNGKHISASAAATLLLMADDLIAALESNPAPSVGQVAAAIEAIRQQVLADRANGAIDSDGISNSLLVKLAHGDAANNGASGDLQTQTFSYDANGNRINKEFPGPQGPQIQGMDYVYDPENRLVVAQAYQQNQQGNRVDRGITTLEYDGGGRRLAKTYDPNEGGGGPKRVEYVFDGWDPVAEYNTWNPQYENFYRGALNRIITMHHFPSGTQGQMYWFHYDGLGSTSGLTKQNGNSHHNYRYEAYGEIEHAPGNHTDPHNHYTFTGQEWDENMGLYEFYARDYDPVTGVWLSQDTYRGTNSIPSSLHRYQYGYNNPSNYIDEYGHFPWLAVGIAAVVVIVGGAIIYDAITDNESDHNDDHNNDNETYCSTTSSGYDRCKAGEYARNYGTPDNYNEDYATYDGIGGNCTNFVSQVLKAGGLDFVGEPGDGGYGSSWYYQGPNIPERTPSWTGVEELYNHMQYWSDQGERFKRISDPHDLEVGDVISIWKKPIDENSEATPSHTMIVSDKDADNIYVASNTRHYSREAWFGDDGKMQSLENNYEFRYFKVK